MFCNNCGKEITEDAKFCIYCGQANSIPEIWRNTGDVFIQVTENFAVNEKRKKVRANGQLFDFSEITDARVVENMANVGGNVTTRVRGRKTIDCSSKFRNGVRSF